MLRLTFLCYTTVLLYFSALWELGRLIHDIRSKWSIPSNCPCGSSNSENITEKNGINAVSAIRLKYYGLVSVTSIIKNGILMRGVKQKKKEKNTAIGRHIILFVFGK